MDYCNLKRLEDLTKCEIKFENDQDNVNNKYGKIDWVITHKDQDVHNFVRRLIVKLAEIVQLKIEQFESSTVLETSPAHHSLSEEPIKHLINYRKREHTESLRISALISSVHIHTGIASGLVCYVCQGCPEPFDYQTNANNSCPGPCMKIRTYVPTMGSYVYKACTTTCTPHQRYFGFGRLTVNCCSDADGCNSTTQLYNQRRNKATAKCEIHNHYSPPDEDYIWNNKLSDGVLTAVQSKQFHSCSNIIKFVFKDLNSDWDEFNDDIETSIAKQPNKQLVPQREIEDESKTVLKQSFDFDRKLTKDKSSNTFLEQFSSLSSTTCITPSQTHRDDKSYMTAQSDLNGDEKR
ncbi:unnamed protein product, partial [Didymodactylos carnosus]